MLAALIGPYFVDWSAYRAVFETEAGRVLGENVRVLGKAEATLLPTPSLTFTDVVVGPAGGEPKMTVERFDIDIELTPLLKGEVRVQKMALAKPVLRIVVAEDGRLDWLGERPADGRLAPESVVLEHVEMQGGQVTVLDRRVGREWTVNDVSVLLEAGALVGPYRLEANFRQGTEPYSLRAATGKVEADGSIRLKLALNPVNQPLSLIADGKLGRDGGHPSYLGTVEIAEVVVAEEGEGLGRKGDREGPRQPWRLDGQFDLDAERLLFSALELKRGGEGHAFGITGTAQLAFGATPRFDAVLSSRQIDLDRSLGGGPEAPTDIPAAAAALARFLADLPRADLPGRVGFDVPAVVVGGGIVQDLRFDAVTGEDGTWRIETLEAQFPGQTRLTANGRLSVTPKPAFDGLMTLDAAQPAAFAAWWRQAAEAPLKARVPIEAIVLSSNISLRPNTVILSEMSGTLGKADVSGFLGWTDSNARKRAFTADLEADRLDLDQLRALAELMAPEGGGTRIADSITVTLLADSVVVEGVEMKGVATALAYDADRLKIERLDIADAAGARVSAKGKIDGLSTAPDGGIEISVDASRLDGLGRVVGDLFPASPVAAAIAARAPAFAPARLEGRIEAARNPEGSRIAATLSGTAGASDLAVKGDFSGRIDAPTEAVVGLSLSLASKESRGLLAQLGTPGLPVDFGAASFTVDLAGVPQSGLSGKAALALGETGLSAEGTLTLAAGAAPVYAAKVEGRAADVVPLALAAGLAIPGLGEVTPARVALSLDGKGRTARLADVGGAIGGRGFSGAANLDWSRGAVSVKGELATDEVDLPWLFGLAVGPAAALDDGSGRVWSEAAFAEYPFGDASVDLAVKAKRVYLPFDYALADAAFGVRTTPAESSVENLAGSIGGGRFEGRLGLRRGADGTTLSGRVRLADAALEEFVWRRDASPVANGNLSLSGEFEGSGHAMTGVIASLGGGGSFAIRDATVRGLNPVAFSSVVRAADAGLELTAEKVRDVFAGHLDAGTLAVATAEGAFAISGGVLRARNVSVSTESATTLGGASIDLGAMTLDSSWTLAVDPGPEERVAGAEPQVAIAFTGPLADPTRRIDATGLTGYLTVRAFEREVRRIEEMQADILEKERFAREARRLRELEARRERERKAAAEAEARRKAEDAARRKAEEEALKKAVDGMGGMNLNAGRGEAGPLILVPPLGGITAPNDPATGAPLILTPIR